MSCINGKKISKKTQLYHVNDWNLSNIAFCDAESKTIPGKDMGYHVVNVLTKNVDSNGKLTGTYGDLILEFDKMFSFGVTENVDQKTNELTGHSMSFAMWTKDAATEREIQATTKLEELIEVCTDHTLSIRKDIKKPKLERSDLKGFKKMLYWKLDEDGERIPGIGPIMSTKLHEYSSRTDPKSGVETPRKIVTAFYKEDEVDENGEPVEIDPLDLISTKTSKKFFVARPCIKIDSLYFGAHLIIRCKVIEADIQQLQSGPQKLLHRSRVTVNPSLVLNKTGKNSMTEDNDIDDSKDDSKIEKESKDDSKEEKVDKLKKKKVVKKEPTLE